MKCLEAVEICVVEEYLTQKTHDPILVLEK